MTATSDSADEDDEKEVAELERELSRCSRLHEGIMDDFHYNVTF